MKKAVLFSVFMATVATAADVPSDIFEIGGNLALRFDSNIYKNNSAIDYSLNNSSVYPFIGDFKNDSGVNIGVGHRFSGRRADYGVLIKYAFRSSGEEVGTRLVYNDNSPASSYEVANKGFVREHDVTLCFRLSPSFFPYDWMHIKNLYVDLGVGVSTVVYDFEYASRSVHMLSDKYYYIGPGDVFGDVSSRKIVRSGLIGDIGIGYKFPIHETIDVTVRSDFNLGKIQDIKGVSGDLIHEGPNVNGMVLSVGLIKSFKSIF
jgi:hypothetical protein